MNSSLALRDFEEDSVIAASPDLERRLVATDGVYPPGADSHLLIDTLARTTTVAGRSVADLCTGSGVVAVAAARLGAARVTAWDVCPRAVDATHANADAFGLDVDVRLGSFEHALTEGPYDVVACNPPYVPTPPVVVDQLPSDIGHARAWNAGPRGRLVLDPLCACAPRLLTRGGTMLVVQSGLAGIDRTLEALRSGGLMADVVVRQLIPFGPVLSARSRWLQSSGLLPVGRREEELVVIRAEKP